MPERFDAVVIGSGFGGAVAACRLAEQHLSVLVLERGRRWSPDSFPREPGDAWIFDADAPERRNGWIDLRVFRDLAVVQGAGVGGGSLIYANVFVPPDRSLFAEGWPAEIRDEDLDPLIAETGRMLQVAELPDGQLSERHRLMRDAAAATGASDRLRKLPLAISFDPGWHEGLPDSTHPRHSTRFSNRFGRMQGTCTHCGDCVLGCPVGARNTLDLNYLARAEQRGAEIRALHLVHSLEPDGSGYRVHYERLQDGERRPGAVYGERVILAAGSLGSTELLLRCRDAAGGLPDLSPALGRGWCANGDFLTPAFHAGRRISPTRGPTITTAIDYLDGADGGQRYFVEDGGFPDLIGNALRAMLGRHRMTDALYQAFARHLDLLRGDRDPMAHLMPWFGQGVDASNGVMTLERSLLDPDTRALDLTWDADPSKAVIEALIARHQTLSAATGGEADAPPNWRWFKYLVTPHPLGGCNMADGPDDGVVDHAGRVFNYPRLYVMDGAAIPRALGLNPSRTIATLAERNVRLLLQE